MLGSKRNRARHGDKECSYGCCKSFWSKKISRRVMRNREKRQWNKDKEEQNQ